MGISIMLLVAAMLALSIGVEARKSAMDIDANLKLLNKPAVKTIKSGDGDIIDCVDIYKQPAFDNPALKHHKIQMRPNFVPASNKTDNASKSVVSQIWQRSGSCPNETIPIRRIQQKDLIRAASFKHFAKKPAAQFMNSSNITDGPNSPLLAPLANRTAAYLVTMGYNYIGAQADINVWNPHVDLPDDFTTAQIWLKAGNGPLFESVEAGWVVNPKLYGDTATRLFGYWTRDSYQSTGCFDLACPGFVHTNKDIALGAAIQPISSSSGPQYQITVGIFMDESGHWWVKVGDIPVGYWPTSMFGSLAHSATLVEWGGEVLSSQVKKAPHTARGMGSGDFADGLFGRASYMSNVRIKDYSQALKYPEFVSTWAEEPYCYNSKNYMERYGAEPVFYFGGPGRHPPYCS